MMLFILWPTHPLGCTVGMGAMLGAGAGSALGALGTRLAMCLLNALRDASGGRATYLAVARVLGPTVRARG